MTSDNDASPKECRSRSKSLPRGRYTLVGIDIDTTGRRLIDEIVQLSAFTPKSQYSQYIMPYMNLNPAARQRHQVRVITIGFFRMLKNMQTSKVVKTKSEIAALLEFLDWLEKIQKSDPDSNGIILIYHEQRKFIPYMILEAFKKYDLLSRFLSTVRSFANGFNFAETKCANTVKYLNLRQLSKVLLNTDDKNKNLFEGNAAVRARLAYEIAQHLAKGELKDLTEEFEMENMSNIVYEYSHPVSHEIAELKTQREILEKQNSLRPIFLQYFKTTLFHRVKAVTFRRILAENGLDYDTLKKMWDENKMENIAIEIEKFEELKPDYIAELIELLDCHFDPEKTPLKPAVKSRQRKVRNRRNSRRENKENRKPKSEAGPSPTAKENSPKTGSIETTPIKTKLPETDAIITSPPPQTHPNNAILAN